LTQFSCDLKQVDKYSTNTQNPNISIGFTEILIVGFSLNIFPKANSNFLHLTDENVLVGSKLIFNRSKAVSREGEYVNTPKISTKAAKARDGTHENVATSQLEMKMGLMAYEI
jgi:hypothetical protein